MMYLLLMTLALSGCTFRVETRSDEQIAADKTVKENNELAFHCIKKCAPFEALSFSPSDWHCQCKTKSQHE